MKLKHFLYNFTFLCTLFNEDEKEQEFDIVLKGGSLILVKDKLEDFLRKNWGFITMRIYFKENVKSSRYWNVELVKVEALE